MGYFDDPKHRAQWEKELSALREEKARIKAGLQSVSGESERTADKNLESTLPERDFAEVQKSVEVLEEKTIYRAEPERKQFDNAISERETVRKAPERAPFGRPEGEYRIKTSFQELLREENMDQPQKLTKKPRELERQKEVSHEL